MMIAGETDEACRPVHLLEALAELDGPIGVALVPGGGARLFPARTAAKARGGRNGYVCMQTCGAARAFAVQRGETPGPEHLLVAMVDQADPEAMGVLNESGIEIGRLRDQAVRVLGERGDLTSIALPPLIPAGTMDRPPLPVEDLNPPAWAVLEWRQQHLPLDRVKRESDWNALSHLEFGAAWGVCNRLAVDDDQRYSLITHHQDRVKANALAARGDVVVTRQQLRDRHPHGPAPILITNPLRSGRRWHRFLPAFMVGWPTWFGNRRVRLRDKRFRLITRSAYRGQPKIGTSP
jgi:hypothetical protein